MNTTRVFNFDKTWHYRLVDGRILEGVMVQTLMLSTLGKDRLNRGTYVTMPHTTASWVQTKAEVALASHWIWQWNMNESHSLCTTFKVLYSQFTTGAIRIPLFLRYHHQCPSSSPPPHLSCWLVRPHRGYRLSSQNFPLSNQLSSILQRPHTLALMLLKLARFYNHF